MRYRDSIEETSLITPSEVYELTVEIWETSNVFKAGHRMRLEVSSSNFPRFERNLNTGNRPGFDAEMQKADQTVYHDAARPSHLILPSHPPLTAGQWGGSDTPVVAPNRERGLGRCWGSTRDRSRGDSASVLVPRMRA